MIRRLRGLKKDCQYRYVIAIMLFTGGFMFNMLRVDISLSVIGLLERLDNTSTSPLSINNRFISEEYNDRPKLTITKNMFASLLASYYVGFLLTIFTGFTISVAVGPLWTVGALTIFASLMTGVIPYMVHLNFYTGIVNMFFVGLCAGPMIPSCHLLTFNWAPPEEEHTFTILTTLGYMSGYLVWPILGIVVADNGWQWGFFTPCLIGLIWSFVWLILVSNNPETSRFTSEKEKKYIQARQQQTVQKIKLRIPYADILKSKEVWAFIMARLGIAWISSIYAICQPIIIKFYAGYTIKENGIFSVLPITAKAIVALAAIKIYNVLIRSKRTSPLRVQKIFIMISHFVAALLLFGIYFITWGPLWLISIEIAIHAIGGFEIPVYANYPQQVSPNFYGIIYRLCVMIPTTCMCIMLPFLSVGDIGMTFRFQERHIVPTAIGLFLYIAGALAFITFGSETIQPWND